MKTALLVLNFGGPQQEREVESFLYELFSDKDVIPMPFGTWGSQTFADLIAPRRAPKTIAQYDQIGGGSPLVPMTFRQADALGEKLAEEGLDLPIFVGMRYTKPSIKDALVGALEAGAERLVALALYPHFSIATTGSAYNELTRQMQALGASDMPLHCIPAFFDDPDYVAALADTVRRALASVPPGAPPHLLFTAHGLPASFIRKGDPYLDHVQATVRAVIQTLQWRGAHSLSFQSRVGPARWLGPSVEEELGRLAEGPPRAIVAVPVSFVGDHIETLYEIDVEYKELAHELGLPHFSRAAALDTHYRFIQALATQVARALAEPKPRACVRCLLPKDEAHHARKTCLDCKYKKPAYLACQSACPEAEVPGVTRPAMRVN